MPVGTQLDLVVEYREMAGDAAVSVKIGIASNEADTAVDGGGGATGDAPDCNWGRRLQINDAYSSQYMWDEYAGGTFVTGNRCYLEFRGAVYVPDTNGVPDAGTQAMLMPQLVFWDIWDMDDGGTRGWIEVAEYVDNPLGSGRVDYNAMAWQRVNLRQGNTANYNWTRNVIDLTNVGGVDFRGKPVAFRFVMENRGGGGDRNGTSTTSSSAMATTLRWAAANCANSPSATTGMWTSQSKPMTSSAAVTGRLPAQA
ncbi:hypothetical protein HC928_22640 [bacterium]|nr:hypothetical protein [bacterium]